MSIVAKATIFLRINQLGWSETMYCSLDGIGPAASANALAWGKARLSISRPDVECDALRVVNQAAARDSWVYLPGDSQAGSFLGYPQRLIARGNCPVLRTIGVMSEEAGTGFGILMRRGSLSRRVYIVGGVPDDVLSNSGVYDRNTPNWRSVLDPYLRFLLGFASIRAFATTQPRVVVRTLIADPDDHHRIFVTTASPPQSAPNTPVVAGDRLIIRGYKGGYRINAVWRIREIASDGTYLLGPHRRNVAVNAAGLQGDVTAQFATYTFAGYTSADDRYPLALSHKVGRPFGLRRGRSPAR
jgi:hypothetical protein